MKMFIMKMEGKSPIPVVETDETCHDVSTWFDSMRRERRLSSTLLSPFDSLFQSPNPRALCNKLMDEAGSYPSIEPAEYEIGLPLFYPELICVGRSYAAHARELGNPVPDEPVIFQKPRSSLIATGQPIHLPKECVEVHYEGELALVIGSDLHADNTLEEAEKAILAVTLLNDVTDRNRQSILKKQGKPWLTAKGKESFAPMGPCLLYLENLEMLKEMKLETHVNGELRQSGSPQQWLWPAPEMILRIARLIGLHKGTVVSTGTPPGVGPVRDGDSIVISANEIGELKNTINGYKEK